MIPGSNWSVSIGLNGNGFAMPHQGMFVFVNNGSINDLAPDDAKPLPY